MLRFLVFLLTPAARFAAQRLVAQNAFTPDWIKWGPAPPLAPPGGQLAVLEGDPRAVSGDYCDSPKKCRTGTRSLLIRIHTGKMSR